MKRAIRRPAIILSILILFLLMICVGGYIAVDVRPSLGAQGADLLRSVLGTKPVAWMEDVAFRIEDTFHRVEYSLGARPSAPWGTAVLSLPTPPASPTFTNPTAIAAASSTPETTITGPTLQPTPTFTATPVRWPPASIPALGNLPGEGQWAPYFADAQGDLVAYRTFLQPDPSRPYTIAAIVAVDLTRTRLHYMLGLKEPDLGLDVPRTGIIPREDKQPGILLAAFNGGFQTKHGAFGVMVDGRTVVPMRAGFGSLAIFEDGQVQIGVWGTDFTSYDGIAALRQNGPMIIQNGAINPQTNDDDPSLWGYTADGKAPTWRSAVGLSADEKTLYYVVGPSLTIAALAQSLRTTDVGAAIQLDINNYWVLFCTVQFHNKVPTSLPLLTEMNDNVNRYLYASERDYFYLTAAAG